MRSTEHSTTPPSTPREKPLEPIQLRIPEAERVSGLSRSALYKLKQAQKLKFRRYGRTVFVDYRSLKTVIDALAAA
jgi:hypothetical protein